MATKKPNTFTNSSLPLTGDEELYTQTGGVSEKLNVKDIWDIVPQITNVVLTGTTIINNDTVNVSGGTIMITGGTVIFLTGSTISSGSTSSVIDNIDGTFTHNDDGNPNTSTTIKPVDYSTSEHLTGKMWIDGKPIYRRVVLLPTWTSTLDASGKYILDLGVQSFESVLTLDLFGEYTISKINLALNIGDGTTWSGSALIEYNGVNTYLTWEEILNTSDVYNGGNTVNVTLIYEYTKM